MMKTAVTLLAALTLTACGPSPKSDPIYLVLKKNPPTSISAADLVKLRAGRVACNIFNEDTKTEYQTCWFPLGKPTKAAQLYYYKPVIRGGIYPNNKPITNINF
jgi:hypothetical protein